MLLKLQGIGPMCAGIISTVLGPTFQQEQGRQPCSPGCVVCCGPCRGSQGSLEKHSSRDGWNTAQGTQAGRPQEVGLSGHPRGGRVTRDGGKTARTTEVLLPWTCWAATKQHSVARHRVLPKAVVMDAHLHPPLLPPQCPAGTAYTAARPEPWWSLHRGCPAPLPAALLLPAAQQPRSLILSPTQSPLMVAAQRTQPPLQLYKTWVQN